jgi:magnesium-transporting ATPase (P-type)
LSDRSVNYKKVTIVKNGEVLIKSSNVKVGDILKLKNDEMVPADLLLLSTSNSTGSCLISTTNLNGFGFFFNIFLVNVILNLVIQNLKQENLKHHNNFLHSKESSNV